MDDDSDAREKIRARYAAAARRSAAGDHEQARATEVACCGTPSANALERSGEIVFGGALYQPRDAEGAPGAALAASLGCGVPTAVADLHPGETVLDLGSGAGADVLISARRVAPGGRAIGLDMTREMVDLARRNAADAGVTNIEFLLGYLENIPLPKGSVDVVISNCVINLAVDKPTVLREAARVLRPGGRFAISDVISDADLPDSDATDMQGSTGCIAGALTREQFEESLADAGFIDIEITETHRVDPRASAAIVRARIPANSPAP